jgi:putative membrane protein
MGWGMDLAAWLWMGIWIFALLAMVWLVSRGSDRPSSGEDALAILRARFARGEIDEGEFEHAREVLGTVPRSQGKELLQ